MTDLTLPKPSPADGPHIGDEADLAERLGREGRWRDALLAWRRAFAASRVDDQVSRRAILALSQWYGESRPAAALRLFRMLAAQIPASGKLWAQLAETFTAAGQMDQAIVAWDRVAERGGGTINVQEARDRLWFARVNAKRPMTGPRILVIGNCQALGLALSLRRVCDGSDVSGELWASYQQAGAADRLFADLDSYDLVVSQFFGKPSHAVRSTDLAERSRRFVQIPRIFFTGYHPDLLRRPVAESDARLLMRAWHSVIIAAAHGLGVPKERVPRLFNAYVYGVLGYFAEFEKAKRLQLLEGENVGFDLQDLFGEWIAAGQFVHMPDHPTAATLQSLARAICIRTGLPADPSAPLPYDAQKDRFVWPVYPEIARKLDVPGSLNFLPSAPPSVGLVEAVDHYYRVYEQTGAPDDERVRQAMDLLRREGL